jgi:hypothetical protein
MELVTERSLCQNASTKCVYMYAHTYADTREHADESIVSDGRFNVYYSSFVIREHILNYLQDEVSRCVSVSFLVSFFLSCVSEEARLE